MSVAVQNAAQSIRRKKEPRFRRRLEASSFIITILGSRNRTREALAKPPICASGGFRVRVSGGVTGLNPVILNPVSRRFKGFCKRL
jgi:hypothetical protein